MAYRFWNYSGSSDYLEMSDPGLTRSAGTDGGFTLAFWARLLTYKYRFDYDSVAMVSYGSGSANQGFLIRRDYYGLGLQLRQPGSTSTTFNSMSKWNWRGWNHYVLRFGSGYGSLQPTVFLNGEMVYEGNSIDAYVTVSGYPFRLAKTYDGDGSGTGHGCIDFAEVAYWGVPLTHEQCYLLYDSQRVELVDNANLQLYFPLRNNPTECYGSKASSGVITIYGGNPIRHPVKNPYTRRKRSQRLQQISSSGYARLVQHQSIVGGTSLVRLAA